MNFLDLENVTDMTVPGINMPVAEVASIASFAYGIQRLMRSRKKFQLNVITPILAGYAGSQTLRNYSTLVLAGIAFALLSKPAWRRYRRSRYYGRFWRRRK